MENSIPETDQWKLNGICEKCRREPFCSKTCSAKSRRQDRNMRAAARSFIRMCAPTSNIADNMEKWL